MFEVETGNEGLYGLVVKKALMTAEICPWLLKRCIRLLSVLATVMTVCFVVEAMLPGDPAEVVLGEISDAFVTEKLQEMQRHLNVGSSSFSRALSWLQGAVVFDFGASYRTGEPVLEEIARRLPVTFFLTVITAGWVIPLSFVGAWVAVAKQSVKGFVFRVFAYVGVIIPVYLTGSVLLFIAGSQNIAIASRGVASLLFASFTLGLPLCGFYIYLNRRFLVDVLFSEYVRLAYIKGLSEWQIAFRHVLPALLPQIVVLWSMSIGRLLGGAVIVESLYGLPGIGELLVDAVASRDYPVIQAMIFLSGCFMGVLMELSDTLLPFLNPKLEPSGMRGYMA